MLLALSCMIVTWSLAEGAPLVTLPDGTMLQGGVQKTVSFFKGIPFAEPPVNELRFTPPKPWVNSNVSQVLDATSHGHACMQLFWGDDGLFDDGSEDCLTLNVFVNLEYSAAATEPLPVAIFVHGGSYISGASFLPLYDGVDAVDFWGGKVILVTTNYRVNAFGFLGSESLRGRDPEAGSTGNYGIQDQRLAFDWVRRNIAAFGGDPNRVTIFGESAGAGSMSNHLVMPRSAGLFHRVGLDSGAFAAWNSISMSCAEANYQRILKTTRCSDVDCLIRMPAIELLHASELHYLEGCGYGPVVDGVELETHPWIMLANGDVADVPVLYGTNTDEGAIFTTFPHDGDAEGLQEYWSKEGYTDDEINTLNGLYVDGKTYPNTEFASVYWWAAERSLGDDFMSCPSEYTSQQLGAMFKSGTRKSPAYFYHFEHTPRVKANVTRHVSELEYVFHQPELTQHPDDAAMADMMSSYWANFFANGNPNSHSVGTSHLPMWEAYDVDSDNVVAIRSATDVTTVFGLKQEECAFFIPRLDASIRSQFPGSSGE